MAVRATRPTWAESAIVLMDERGVDVAGAAAAVGLSRRALADRLAGRIRPLTGELVILADVLGVSVDTLLGTGPGGRRRSPPSAALMTIRDRRLYEAAARVDPGSSLRTVAASQAYVDKVVGSNWWADACPQTRLVRVCGCGGGTAASPAWHAAELSGAGLDHQLHLPRWARRPLTILHELAHVACEPIVWARAHGPQFARFWVDLTEEFLGPAKAAELRTALRAERLSIAGRAQVAEERAQGMAELARLLGPIG